MKETYEIEKEIIKDITDKHGFQKLDLVFKQRNHDLFGCKVKSGEYCTECQRWR